MLIAQRDKQTMYYLNKKPIDFNKVFLNPLRIDSIDVAKNSTYDGVLIFTKNSEFSFYRLVDILKKYANIKGYNDSILFKINGKIIEDTTSIKIDDSYFVYVETEKLYGVKYISSRFRNLTIINIDLETKKREPEIRIRGNQEILDKFQIK